ncbi:MAG: hypothetical protein M1379_14455 [Firmicutes bacterium]|nr:hypothetical protein [Bacillota bacterium]
MSKGVMSIKQQVPEQVCIETTKVFDFCFNSQEFQVCTPLLTPCDLYPVDTTVPPTCTITNLTCTLSSRTQDPIDPNLAHVVWLICFDLNITVTGVPGTVPPTCTFTVTHCITKRATIFAPVGTDVSCEFLNQAACACEYVIVNGTIQVCCVVCICVGLQAFAVVKLVVQALGYCVPGPCEEFGCPPGYVCPPEELFPPEPPLP